MTRRRDEYLVNRGLDANVPRTYNRLGRLNDDNGDNFRFRFNRRLVTVRGALNAEAGTIPLVGVMATKPPAAPIPRSILNYLVQWNIENEKTIMIGQLARGLTV